MISVLLGNC